MNDKISFMKASLRRTMDITVPPPPIVPFADWDYYYTLKELKWKANDKEAPIKEVEVPLGFVTDLASIPSIFYSVLPPAARYSYPAIIHDYLYWYQTCSREQADKVFKSAMEDLGVDALKITTIYNAVRIGGGGAWGANAAARNSGEKRVLKIFPDDVKITWAMWKIRPEVFA